MRTITTVIPETVQESSLFLFNKFVVEKKDKEDKFYTSDSLSKYGLFFSELFKDKEEYYLSIYLNAFPYSKVNNTFWTFYDTVKHEKDGTRVLHQIAHYLTTYGAEYLGIKDVIKTYIPNEDYGKEAEGEIKNIKLIGTLSLEELKEKIIELLNTPRGLSNLQIEHIIKIVDFLYKNEQISRDDLLDIQNRDLAAKIYDYFNILPLDFDAFLLYAFQKYFKSRKIKSKQLLNRIKNLSGLEFVREFAHYLYQYGDDAVIQIAKTFRRNKDIILSIKTSSALTTDDKMKKFIAKKINAAKRLSDKGYYQPVYIKLIRDLNYNEFKEHIKKAKLSDLVKYLIYFRKLKNRIRGYMIRNGRIWVDDNIDKIKYEDRFDDYQKLLNDEIAKRITKMFGNLKINSNCDIALPTSMTQFIGNVPIFSTQYFETDKFKLIGIHWYNTDDDRVDLDLHRIELLDDGKVEICGWNHFWSSESTIFSGDMTDAPKPHGAVEYMLIDSKFEDIIAFTVTDYRWNVYKDPSYQFSLILGEFETKDNTITNSELFLNAFSKEDSKIRLENIEVIIPINFKNNSHQILGFYYQNKFIFCNWALFSTSIANLPDSTYIQLMRFVKNVHKIVPKLNDYLSTDDSGVKLDELTTDFWSDYFRN